MYKKRKYGTLKRAAAALVKANGGLTEAARHCRVSRGMLFAYTDEDGPRHTNVHMPADVIAALEARCGAPLVTEWLARNAGFALLYVGAPMGTTEVERELATLAECGGDLFATFGTVLAKHCRIDAEDAERLLRDGDRMTRAYLHLRQGLEGRLGDLTAAPGSGKREAAPKRRAPL